MKRPYQNSGTFFRGKRDTKKDVNQEQLAGIGLVALGFNYAEHGLNNVMAEALNLKNAMRIGVSHRVNGPDAKIAIIKDAAKLLKMQEGIYAHMCNVFGDFNYLRKYRNAVIHCRLLDAKNQIGITVEGKVVRTEVLLTAECLNGAFERLDSISNELIHFMLIFRLLHQINDRSVSPSRKTQAEGHLQEQFALALRRHSDRLSLPKLPQFPELPPTLQAWEDWDTPS